MTTWRRDYNEVRPHSTIGDPRPAELARVLRDVGQISPSNDSSDKSSSAWLLHFRMVHLADYPHTAREPEQAVDKEPAFDDYTYRAAEGRWILQCLLYTRSLNFSRSTPTRIKFES
jgi:hypothetical protein